MRESCTVVKDLNLAARLHELKSRICHLLWDLCQFLNPNVSQSPSAEWREEQHLPRSAIVKMQHIHSKLSKQQSLF